MFQQNIQSQARLQALQKLVNQSQVVYHPTNQSDPLMSYMER